MKKIFFLGLTMVAGLTLATSCSDDNNEPDANETADYTFDDARGLTLTVNGQPMVGKTIHYVNNGETATLTMNSTFDFAKLTGSGADMNIAGPGVLPGSPETVLQLSGTGNSFSGASETPYCTFNYNGTVSATALTLNITDLELKNKSIAGTWVPQPYSVNDDWESEDYGTIYSEPVYAVWESSAQFDFMGTPMQMNDLLRLLMTLPILEDMTVRVPDALTASLRNVTFGTDGDIRATYVDDIDEVNPVVATSPANIAQYVVKDNSSMLFFLNPQAVINADEADSKAGEATAPVDFNNIMGNVMAQLAPMMETGVPMSYAKESDKLRVYLTTETLLPLLKTNVVPLLRNEALVNMLVDIVAADEEMGAFIAPMLPGMIASAADVIDGTTKLEIGLNMQK